jgi:hypothetical protein
MNIKQIMDATGGNSTIVAIIFITVPLLTLILNKVASPNNGEKQWKYIYSGFMYITAVPGIFAGIITLYSLLFLRYNLLSLNVITYYLPIISMVITLAIIRKALTFKEIPGFKRLSGIMVVIGFTFISVIIIERTRIFVISSIQGFVILCLAIFFIFRYGMKLIFGDFKNSNRDRNNKIEE